jgi:hypothetical protein
VVRPGERFARRESAVNPAAGAPARVVADSGRTAPEERVMGKNDEKKNVEQTKSVEDRGKEQPSWGTKHGPTLIVGGAVALIVAMAVAMKMCG